MGCCSESPGVKYATYEMKVESWNMGTRINRLATEPGYPRRLGKVDHEGGACVVVGARESRVHSEGRQGTGEVVETEKPLMDLGDQADDVWLLIRQTMSGFSTCNASFINGAGIILKTAIVTCGTGQPISAIYDAPGGKSLRTKGDALQESTG